MSEFFKFCGTLRNLDFYAATWQLLKYLKGHFLFWTLWRMWKLCNIYWKRRFSSLQDQLMKVEKIGLNNRISTKQNKNQHHTLWLWKYKCNVSGRRTRLTFTSRSTCSRFNLLRSLELTRGPSMSFYPDFISILSWFYPNQIKFGLSVFSNLI